MGSGKWKEKGELAWDMEWELSSNAKLVRQERETPR